MALVVTSYPVDLERSEETIQDVVTPTATPSGTTQGCQDAINGLYASSFATICKTMTEVAQVAPKKSPEQLVKDCISFFAESQVQKRDSCRSFKNMDSKMESKVLAVDSMLLAFHRLADVIVDLNEDISIAESQMTIFHQTPCYMAVCDYLQRFTTFLYTSEHVLVLACVYLLRLANKIVINSQSIHRVLLTSILVATKMVEDKFPSNQSFSLGGGVETWELNLLEVEFLSLFEFNAMTSSEEFERAAVLLQEMEKCEQLIRARDPLYTMRMSSQIISSSELIHYLFKKKRERVDRKIKTVLRGSRRKKNSKG